MSTPRATYRLQLHRGFTLQDAADVAGYLADLGVSHVYLSPILQAAPGSEHGYDCVDPTRIDSERGGEEGFAALHEACARASPPLGIVLDIVPNHLDISGPENRWWRSVLRLGSASEWARTFDVDWERAMRPGGGIAIPVLGEVAEEAIASGAIKVASRGGVMEVCYFEHRFPIRPAASAALLRELAGRLDMGVAEGLLDVARGFQALDRGQVGAGHDGAGQARAAKGAQGAGAPESADVLLDRLEDRLGELLAARPAAAAEFDALLAEISASRERLGELLERQPYRLVHWRETARDIGYRRFFDINTLIGVRVEDPSVFGRTHALVLDLVRQGKVEGLRVDHPDGLRDPRAYLKRLREAAPDAWIVVEKILESGESLPPWPVAGTTGYDFLNDALGLLVDAAGERPLKALYEEVTGASEEYGEVAFEAKLLAARKLLAADLTRLTRLLVHLAKVQPRLSDKVVRLRESIGLLAACMPVYRTYVTPGEEVAPEDRELIWSARGHAERRRPELAPEPLGAIRDVLLLKLRSPAAADRRSLESEFVLRFQQYSAPAMAKGVEDTAFYRYVAFIALNEVGGDPGRFGITPARFHSHNARRARRWPEAMLSTSTHDTKRSEDVRARLAVLSEIPEQWVEQVRRWRRLNERCREERGGVPAGREEYLLYQTLVGAWPIDAERVVTFMRKAVREAKVWTSWREVNERYEAELESFVRRVLENKAFLAELSVFVSRLLRPGRLNALAQALLKLTCPGVPDLYQGCELWDLSLVDPDNRRPVDFALRRAVLKRAHAMPTAQIWATVDDAEDPGTAKLWMTQRVLRERARLGAAFGARSSYTPLYVSGRWEKHVIAYSRGDSEGPRALVVVPRLTTVMRRGNAAEDAGEGEGIDWADTSMSVPPPLDAPAWTNVLGEGTVGPGERGIREVLGDAPLALLVEAAT